MTKPLVTTCVLLLLAAACVGDDVTSVGSSSSSTGSSGTGSSGTGDPDGSPQSSTLTVTAPGIALVRGDSSAIQAVLSWSGPARSITLSLEAPLGFSVAPPQTIAPTETSASLQLSADAQAPYGSATVNVVARIEGSDAIVKTPVAVDVRGVVGTLDTSYGNAGVVDFNPDNGALADVALADSGELLAVTEFGTLARYDAAGRLDTNYRQRCESTLGEDHMAYRHAIELGPNGTWSVIVHHASGDYDVFGHCTMAAAPDNSVTHDPIAHSNYEVPDSPLGLVSLGTSTLVIQDWAATSGPATVTALDANTERVTTWGSNGVVKLIATAPSVQPYRLSDFRASAENVFVLGEAAGSWSVDVLQRTTGALRGRVDVAPSLRTMSRPGPSGAVTLVKSNAQPCLAEIVPGQQNPIPSRCDGDTDSRDALAVYLRDGRRAVVAVGMTTTLWFFDNAGTPLPPLNGYDLKTPLPDYHLVALYEDASRRLVIAAASNTGRSWFVRRYWL